MKSLFKKKPKPELDTKSMHISVMYLHKAKSQLESELQTGHRKGASEVFTAEHDIKCLDKAIKYLQS